MHVNIRDIDSTYFRSWDAGEREGKSQKTKNRKGTAKGNVRPRSEEDSGEGRGGGRRSGGAGVDLSCLRSWLWGRCRMTGQGRQKLYGSEEGCSLVGRRTRKAPLQLVLKGRGPGTEKPGSGFSPEL